MLIIQFLDTIDTSTLPVEIVQSFKHNTYLLDCDIAEYDTIIQLTDNYPVASMSSNEDCAYIDVYERLTSSYTTVLVEDTLAPLIEKLDLLALQEPTILCFSWQMERNYILDYRIEQLIKAGNIVVCAGGNQDLPVLDISPVGVDGVIRVGGQKHNGYYQNWIDIYDITIPNEPNSNKAVHTACTLMVNKQLELDFTLGYYSDSSVRSAPWPLRLAQTPSTKPKYYEFNPVSNLRYCAGEHLLPVRQGDQVSVIYGGVELENYIGSDAIQMGTDMPRGLTFDTQSGWLYGTFKVKVPMFHRFVAEINGQIFEYHIISCDADNKLTYQDVKETYYNRPYNAPPFTMREYWVPMARPVKLLEPGDPFIRTYNLNDLHLYREYE